MQPNIQTLTFPVTGMSCASCAVNVESILGVEILMNVLYRYRLTLLE
jgi:hypothetical protein